MSKSDKFWMQIVWICFYNGLHIIIVMNQFHHIYLNNLWLTPSRCSCHLSSSDSSNRICKSNYKSNTTCSKSVSSNAFAMTPTGYIWCKQLEFETINWFSFHQNFFSIGWQNILHCVIWNNWTLLLDNLDCTFKDCTFKVSTKMKYIWVYANASILNCAFLWRIISHVHANATAAVLYCNVINPPAAVILYSQPTPAHNKERFGISLL